MHQGVTVPHAASPTLAPRPALIGGAIVMLATVALAATGHRYVGGEAEAPEGRPIAERMLVFSDMPDRGVGVFENGKEVTEFTGEQGFLRGVLRGLNRTRKVNGLPGDAPFQLAAYPGGRLILADPATHVTLDLAAYGPTNAEVFARLLPIVEHRAPENMP